jgi:hypothetical protein
MISTPLRRVLGMLLSLLAVTVNRHHLFRKWHPQNIPTEIDPGRSYIAENDVLIEEDAVGNVEVLLQVEIFGVVQVPLNLYYFAVDLCPDFPGILEVFGPPWKLTKQFQWIGF